MTIISAQPGSTGETIHSATASSITPKKVLTPSIQAPARGSSDPADTPTSSSGTLMPMARLNSARPPITTSLVWLMKTSAPASGAATQGPTISADSPPITNTPANLPPGSLPEVSVMRLWMKPGICNSNTPNIDSDKVASISAKAPSTQGFCSAAARPSPSRPATTPKAV